MICCTIFWAKKRKKVPKWIFQVKMGNYAYLMNLDRVAQIFTWKIHLGTFFIFLPENTFKMVQHIKFSQIFTLGVRVKMTHLWVDLFSCNFPVTADWKIDKIIIFLWYTGMPDIRWNFKKKLPEKFLFLQKLWLFTGF